MNTTSGGNQNPPTQDSPNSVACEGGSNQCELRSLSAFQVGSLIILLAGIGLAVYQSLSPQADRDRYSLAQFWSLFGLTVLYYTVNEWFLEERHFFPLRQLHWGNKWQRMLPHLEFWIRVLMVVVLGFTATVPGLLMRFGFKDIDAGFLCLLLLYNLFLVWDVIVATGGQVNLVWKFFGGDLLGAIISLAFFRWYDSHREVGGVLIIILVIVIGNQVVRLEWANLLARLVRRDRLR